MSYYLLLKLMSQNINPFEAKINRKSQIDNRKLITDNILYLHTLNQCIFFHKNHPLIFH